MKKRAILHDTRGTTLAVALVFLGIFLTLTTALLSYVQQEIVVSSRSLADAQALAHAEAGIEYYRWHLAHAADDFTDGTQQTGPYVHEYRNPQGGVVGSFELTIEPRNTCTGSVRIVSRGKSIIDPKRSRVVSVTYGTPALTKYSFLTNANIWFGGNDELKGPVHANGGIRMDAQNASRMTSAKATYICGREHQCNPPMTKPGIWGSGSGGRKGLWDFPTRSINFDAIALDLKKLQQQAVSAQTHFAPSHSFGYHARLKNDGTVDVFRVTGVAPKIWGYDGRTGWVETAEKITSEVFVRTHTIPPPQTCGQTSLLFFEDTVWVDGEAPRPVTLIAARFPESESTNASIILNGNITTPASNKDDDERSAMKVGSVGLIAQKDILIPLESPNNFELHAALFAQKGHVFRNYYCSDERLNRYGYKCKASYAPYILRDTLNLKGTVITNQIAAWTWVNGSGQVITGYRGGENTYDTRLVFSPPPFFPRQGEARILTWEEVNE